MRVSDADREAAAGALREHCGDGRLTLDELSERLEATFAARTREELDHALVDLPKVPAIADPAAALTGPQPGFSAGEPGVTAGEPVRRHSVGWTISVMGNSSHRGRWRPKAVSNVIALMGNCELDLRQAEVDGPEVVINAISLMGCIDIVVPEGIEVELTGVPIMGNKELLVRPMAPIPGAPRVRVRGFMLMGNVVVRSKSHGDQGDAYRGIGQPMGPGSGPMAGPGWGGPGSGLGMGGPRIARDLLRQARMELHHERHARRRAARRGWR